MKYFLLFMDIIPIIFVLYFFFNEYKNKQVIKENELIYLYGGGFIVRKKLNYILIIYIVITLVLFVLYFFDMVNLDSRPFLYYGLVLPVSMLHYSFIKSIYIGKQGVLIGEDYYYWSSEKLTNNIIALEHTQNEKSPYLCTIKYGEKEIKTFVPISVSKNYEYIASYLNNK
jgi:hypothetical protein